MSGCLEELLARDPTVKVVIASGYTGEYSMGQLLKTGAKGFVSKPYDIKNVLKVIRELLDAQP